MNSTKPWYASATIWGGIVALLGSIAGMFGHPIATADQTALVDDVVSVATSIGAVVAIAGHYLFKKSVTASSSTSSTTTTTS